MWKKIAHIRFGPTVQTREKFHRFLRKKNVQKIKCKIKKRLKDLLQKRKLPFFITQTHTYIHTQEFKPTRVARISLERQAAWFLLEILSDRQKRRYPTRVRTLEPQNSSPPSYQLPYNHYIPLFLTIASILSINTIQIERFWDYAKIEQWGVKNIVES